MAKEFYNERNRANVLKLRQLLTELPAICREFFVGIEQITTPLTRLNYAYDLRVFFRYIADISGYELLKIGLPELNQITSTNIENFLSYLSYYEQDGKSYTCSEQAKSRKLATLRSFFKYLFNKDKITANVAAKVQMPKIHERNIIKLEVDEITRLIDLADSGEALTPREKSYHARTRLRDLAMLTLFLGTGIRISECVGLNVDDIDFSVNGFSVVRKGGSQTVLYFSDEVAAPLKEYIFERNNKLAEENITGENALFLSLQNKRISSRAVQNIVKKYSSIITPLKHITPHKLRSTYGTALYSETKDIYIVADVLGHKDVNTTKKHYAAISEELRRAVAGKVKLKDDTTPQKPEDNKPQE